ncbi:putative signal transduction histidine kinase [Alistipes sp. CAG:831]|nr:putative signal transduction histidine kinase [Alistipes sp. CAG:831]
MSEESSNRGGRSQVSTVDLMVIIIIVLFARILIERAMPLFYESFGLYFGDFLFQTLSNYSLTFGAVLGDILIVVLLVRFFPYGSGRTIVRSLVEVGAIALMAFLTSLLIRIWQYPHLTDGSRFFGRLFLFTYVSNLIFNAVAILITDLVFYYRWTNRKAVAVEAEQRAKANYQYQLLKSETNPHFLFNCLTVLQYLIHEDADRASDYAGKLAGVYRYFLKLEKHTLVMLEEELEFVGKYCDLLRERFGESFVTDIDIPERYHGTRIIPCTLQMMVENAVKHNVVNSSSALHISIKVEMRHIVVRNNLNPKKTEPGASTGTGLQNISRQYEILFNRRVTAEKTDSEFIVRIPVVQ